MILTVEADGATPIYQQIRHQVVVAIAEQRLAAGDRLPATRQLASDLSINFHTVNKAYDVLRAEGLLRLNRNSGAVVSRDARTGPPSEEFRTDWEARMRTMLAEAVAQGVKPADAAAQAAEIAKTFRRREPQ